MQFSSPLLQLLQVQTAEHISKTVDKRSELQVYSWFSASTHKNAHIFRFNRAELSVSLLLCPFPFADPTNDTSHVRLSGSHPASEAVPASIQSLVELAQERSRVTLRCD